VCVWGVGVGVWCVLRGRRLLARLLLSPKGCVRGSSNRQCSLLHSAPYAAKMMTEAAAPLTGALRSSRDRFVENAAAAMGAHPLAKPTANQAMQTKRRELLSSQQPAPTEANPKPTNETTNQPTNPNTGRARTVRGGDGDAARLLLRRLVDLIKRHRRGAAVRLGKHLCCKEAFGVVGGSAQLQQASTQTHTH